MAVEIERAEIRMGEMIYRLFAPNLIVVCVDERKGNDCAGKFWQQYEKRSCPFQTIGDLFFQMEDLFNDWNFPQSSNRPRTFAEEIGMEEAELAGKRTTRIKRGKRADLSDLHDQKGKLATFVIQVQYRQNSSWQGQVIWVEENRKEHFRSALELMKLMDNALEERMRQKEAAQSSVS